ncbi:CHAT domain-containing protein [Novosphingobium sp.]|uniref:CHAT domain-containing protein n=1 Tax=Novosphingobium sp. TaxID=1874826 RepID=UPI003B52E55A
MTKALLTTVSVIVLIAGGSPAFARQPDVPDHVELGRNGKGDACVANRLWQDPASPDIFTVSLAMTCRGGTASRNVAIVRRARAANAAAIRKFLTCGAATDFTVSGLGTVHARQCFDRQLDYPTVETSFEHSGYIYSASAIAPAQVPAEQALRLLASKNLAVETNRTAALKPQVDVGTLAAAPPQAVQVAVVGANSAEALGIGLRDIRAGLYPESSRILNDALSRLQPDAPIATRVELLLLAGLADSNLGYFDAAETRFAMVQNLLDANPKLANAAVLGRERTTYIALDRLNQQKYDEALAKLDSLTIHANTDQPLQDLARISEMNKVIATNRRHIEGSTEAPDGNALSQLVIDGQVNWARAVVLLNKGKPDEAQKALDQATNDVNLLIQERIDKQPILWLQARIERERARVLLATGDRAGALKAVDAAIATLQLAQSSGEVGPVMIEAEFERAAITAMAPSGKDDAIRRFGEAMKDLSATDSQGAVLPSSIEKYLDLLIDDFQANPAGSAPEQFFKAVQLIGNPAIARQFIALQTAVAASPALASKFQDVQDLEHEITRIRYEAISVEATAPKTAAELNEQRDGLEKKLVILQTELLKDQAYSAVNDAPATIKDIQGVLQPGEAYFKLARVHDTLFGVFIDQQGAVIYKATRPAKTLEQLATLVRTSIDGDEHQLKRFAVGAANALFQLLTGPITDRLLSAKSLIVDPAGPLQQVPITVLVADKASVAAFLVSSKKDIYDYSRVDFIARRMAVSVALSPRSLIVARSLSKSSAPLPFMGFAQHQPAPLEAQVGDQLVSVGSDCLVERKAIAELTRELAPINASELDRAGAALGLAEVPKLTGAAFTDVAVMNATNLNQFQVLHFATHGATEGQWGCKSSPPGLVTSLGGPPSAAFLSFDEIARLKLDANLVVLSACNTAAGISISQARATGREDAGASLEGLVRAFLAANARAVMSTYWPISNAGESEQLMVDFYRSARTSTIGDALRVAQTAILSNPATSHPFRWGAFFIVGDAQKPLLTGTARSGLAFAGADFSNQKQNGM